MNADQPSIGGKIGGRVASLVSAATVTTRQQLAPHTVRLAMQVQESFFSLVGSEIRSTVGEPLARVADHPDAPEWVRKTFDFLSRGHGQWQAFLAQSVSGQALGIGLGPLLANELTPVTSRLIASNPNSLVDPATMASLVARGHIPYGVGASEAARQGVDGDRFRMLIGLNRRSLDPGSLITAWLRGVIDDTVLDRELRDASFSDEAIDEAKRIAFTPLSPVALADMVQRGILGLQDGAETALKSGTDGNDFSKLVEASGQSLGLQDLLFLFRRKKIDRSRLEHGIRQGNVRNEWIPEVEQLGVVPMSTADAIAAAVQNHLPISAAKRIAEENGLEPSHFQPLYDTAGAPLSTSEMLQLWRRGIVTQTQVEQALREGRLKNKYIPDVLHLKQYVFPPDTVRVMYERGAIDKRTALRKLAEYGVEGEDAAAYLIAAEHTKMATSRDLTMSTIRTLYADRAISHTVAVKNLVGLGYDETEAGQILSVVTLERNQATLNTAISRVHARYIAHRIDVTQATTALDALQVPPDQRDSLLDTWGIERDLNTPQLSPSQITKAAKTGLITPRDAYERLLQLGYDQVDAGILLALAGVLPGE